jgi:hypothetical protein
VILQLFSLKSTVRIPTRRDSESGSYLTAEAKDEDVVNGERGNAHAGRPGRSSMGWRRRDEVGQRGRSSVCARRPAKMGGGTEGKVQSFVARLRALSYIAKHGVSRCIASGQESPTVCGA